MDLSAVGFSCYSNQFDYSHQLVLLDRMLDLDMDMWVKSTTKSDNYIQEQAFRTRSPYRRYYYQYISRHPSRHVLDAKTDRRHVVFTVPNTASNGRSYRLVDLGSFYSSFLSYPSNLIMFKNGDRTCPVHAVDYSARANKLRSAWDRATRKRFHLS